MDTLVRAGDGHVARQRMAAWIQRWEDAGDRRAIFLRCYALTTDHVLLAVQSGDFQDGDWVLQLIDQFAEYYFRTVETEPSRASATVPPAWRIAHELATSSQTAACEALMLGVNAHINNDLAQAVCDTLVKGDTRLPQRRVDFETVNDVIAETMDVAQRDIVEPVDRALAAIDHHLHPVMRVAEWEVQRVITSWRADVWRNAIALLETAELEARAPLVSGIERGAAHRAHLFMCEVELREHVLMLPAHELERLVPHGGSPTGCRLDDAREQLQAPV